MPSRVSKQDIDAKAARDPKGFALANCIRALSIGAVETANSGYPGAPMGMADAATAPYRDHLKFDASGSVEKLYPHFGITRDAIVARAETLLDKAG